MTNHLQKPRKHYLPKSYDCYCCQAHPLPLAKLNRWKFPQKFFQLRGSKPMTEFHCSRVADYCLHILAGILDQSRSNPLSIARQSSQLSNPHSSHSRFHSTFFFPPVWPIRTRLGPYNCVSSEKQKCTRTRVVQKLWQIITKPKTNKTTTKPPQPKTTRKSPSQICVSPQIKTAKPQRTGQGPTKQKTHSDLP